MRSPEELRRAHTLVGLTRDFLREKGKGGAAVLTFEFQAGALCAIEWMLESSEGDDFDKYLASLEQWHQVLVAGGS